MLRSACVAVAIVFVLCVAISETAVAQGRSGGAPGQRFVCKVPQADPGDPQECRQHARHCQELAEQSATPQGRQTFLALISNMAESRQRTGSAKAFLNATDSVKLDALEKGSLLLPSGDADSSLP